MYWLDFAIIYFALGAPFGVLRITTKRQITPFSFFRMASGYVLWPLVAIRNVARFFTAKPAAEARASAREHTTYVSTSPYVSERQARRSRVSDYVVRFVGSALNVPLLTRRPPQNIDAIRVELERTLFANAGAFPESESTLRDIYAFREVFYRYTGLAATIAAFDSALITHNSPLINSPFTVHHSPLIRAACIARRDRQKLDVHFRTARKDFVEMLGATYHTEIDRTVEALAQFTGDNALISALYSR